MGEPLYEAVDRLRLREMLAAFSSCLGVPAQVMDAEGRTLEHCGEESGFCQRFHRCTGLDCGQTHRRASQDAVQFGGTYIFACPANLNHIVFPVTRHGRFLGAVLAGPFLMDRMDSTLLTDAAARHAMALEDVMELYDAAGTIPVVPPARVREMDTLLYYLCAGLVEEGHAILRQNRDALQQQSRISESIQMYKEQDAGAASYPLEKERELMTKVKTGDLPQAKAVLNDLLGYVLFSEGNSLDAVKARAVELCALLSRVAIEGGAPTDDILRLNNQFLKRLPSLDSLDNLCYRLQEMVVRFSQSMFPVHPAKNREWATRAVEYIARHYASPLTLEDAARAAHLNPAYFSTLFKQTMGSSFKEYLNMVRVEEAKRLLARGTDPIVDIAAAVGFESQSYFAKVFKRCTGLTPKEYRG